LHLGHDFAAQLLLCDALPHGHITGGAMKIAYLVSAGAADPTRASIPLHLAANGSLELGQEASIILAGDATELLLGENADRLEGVGLPPVRDLVAKLREHAVPIYV
jgi:predicted peroxiredoxin